MIVIPFFTGRERRGGHRHRGRPGRVDPSPGQLVRLGRPQANLRPGAVHGRVIEGDIDRSPGPHH